MSGIEVTYIYSACIVTRTPDLSVLHDPWFTQGIYDGAWYHFPFISDPLSVIGDVDYIYVSHIHPDHFDPQFLRAYFARYGVKPVLIADHRPNHLQAKARAEGIQVTVLDGEFVRGQTRIKIIPHQTGSLSDIDSAFILTYDDGQRRHCLLNTNDINFDADICNKMKEQAGEIDILTCGYAGAGPYPQTYYASTDPLLAQEAQAKRELFLRRYQTLTGIMKAKVNLPFAGKYVLGGRLAALNPVRGVPDPVDVLALDPHAIVLADAGSSIDTLSLQPTAVRTQAYDAALFATRMAQISQYTMDYERLISADEVSQLPLKRLLAIAVRNAIAKSECDEDYYFCIQLPNGEYAVINAHSGQAPGLLYVQDKTQLPQPRSEVYLDPRYLFGLLTHVYHWNNADIGSQFTIRRVPNMLMGANNRYSKKVQWFLNFLTV